jgi:integrase
MLEAHIGSTGKSAEDLLFTTPTGAALRNSNFRNTVWNGAVGQLAEELGVSTDLRLHDLRHTAASLAISCGGSIKAVQRMLGHRKASTTLDIYGHLYADDLDQLAERLEEKATEAA